MNNKRNSIQLNLIIVLLLVFLIMLIVLVVLEKKEKTKDVYKSPEVVGISIQNEELDDATQKAELEKVKAMNERTRIEHYVAKYIKLLEDGEYSTAYNFLNDEYKKNYFSSSEKQFEEYCRSKFSKMMDISYDNFERNGDVYVVWITMRDSINGTQNSGTQISFVVKENNFNNYELSFSKV